MFQSLSHFWDTKMLKRKLEQEKRAAQKKAFEQLRLSLRANIYTKNFEENKTLLRNAETQWGDVSELLELCTAEEKNFFQEQFLTALKEKNYAQAEAFLPELQKRLEIKAYQKLENKLQHQKNTVSSFDKIILPLAETFHTLLSKRVKIPRSMEEFQNLFESYKSKAQTSFSEITETEKAFHQTEKVLQSAEEGIIELPEENVSSVENIFSETKTEKDILDSILFKEKEKEEIEKETEKTDSKFALVDEEKVPQMEDLEYINPFLKYLDHSYHFMMVSIMLLVTSFSFFFIQFDEQNRVLSFLNQENLFIQTDKLKAEQKELDTNIKKAEKRIAELNQGTVDLPSMVALNEIALRKIDWIQLRNDLETATLSAFPYNNVLKYIRYTSFQGDAKKGTVSISGTIQDPSGRVFQMLAKLVKSINTHPSFSGADVKTFSKNKYENENEEGYSTTFSLVLQYHKDKEKESLESADAAKDTKKQNTKTSSTKPAETSKE